MKWLSDMLRIVYLGGNQDPHLLFHSYRVFIPQVNHKRSPELTDLSSQTYCCITHSRFIHYMCTKISLEDVQYHIVGGFPGGAVVENPPANAGTRVRALVWEDPTCRGATRPVSHNY